MPNLQLFLKVSVMLSLTSLLFSCSAKQNAKCKMHQASSIKRAPLDKTNVIIFYLDDSGYGYLAFISVIYQND